MQQTADANLVREIRRWDFVALVLNSVIGAGIFGLPSRVYALAGTYSLLAYGVCAIAVVLMVLCFSEVSSRFKHTGGPYLYARVAFGPMTGFQVGWLMWLARLTAFAALCNLFVDYLSYFLPASGSGTGRVLAITAVLSFLAAANLVGIRVASAVTNTFTLGKLIPLLLLVAAGLFFIDTDRYSLAAPPSYGDFSTSVLLLVFAFSGFEVAVIPAGEGRDPQRHLPFALLTGIGFVVLLYTLIQAVSIGVVPELGSSERPLADAGRQILGTPGASLISIGALISIMGTMNGAMIAAPRLLFAMAANAQLPRVVSATHVRFHTPHVAIMLSAIVMLAFTLLGTFISALTVSTLIRLITYAATCAALPVLRRKSGQPPPAFVAPAGNWLSVAALALVLWLLSSSSWNEALLVGVAAAIGLLLYGALARKRSERRVPAL